MTLTHVQSWSSTWRIFVPRQKTLIQFSKVFTSCFFPFSSSFPSYQLQLIISFLWITDNLDDDDAPLFGAVENIEDGEAEDILQQAEEEEEESDKEFGDILNSQYETKLKATTTDSNKKEVESTKNKQKASEKTPKKKDKGKGKKKAERQESEDSDDCESVASPDSDEEEIPTKKKSKQDSFTKSTPPKKQGSSSQTKTPSPPKEGVLKKPAPQKRDQPAKDSAEVCFTMLLYLYITYISKS